MNTSDNIPQEQSIQNRPRKKDSIDYILAEIEKRYKINIAKNKKYTYALWDFKTTPPMKTRLLCTQININFRDMITNLLPAAAVLFLSGGMSTETVITAGVGLLQSFKHVKKEYFCVYLLSIKLSHKTKFRRKFFTNEQVENEMGNIDCLHMLGKLNCPFYIEKNCKITRENIDNTLDFLTRINILKEKKTSQYNSLLFKLVV